MVIEGIGTILTGSVGVGSTCVGLGMGSIEKEEDVIDGTEMDDIDDQVDDGRTTTGDDDGRTTTGDDDGRTTAEDDDGRTTAEDDDGKTTNEEDVCGGGSTLDEIWGNAHWLAALSAALTVLIKD
jgi:hypothetical protein